VRFPYSLRGLGDRKSKKRLMYSSTCDTGTTCSGKDGQQCSRKSNGKAKCPHADGQAFKKREEDENEDDEEEDEEDDEDDEEEDFEE